MLAVGVAQWKPGVCRISPVQKDCKLSLDSNATGLPVGRVGLYIGIDRSLDSQTFFAFLSWSETTKEARRLQAAANKIVTSCGAGNTRDSSREGNTSARDIESLAAALREVCGQHKLY